MPPVTQSARPLWRGGEYSAFRAMLGVYLAIFFATLIPFGTELFSNLGMVSIAGHSPFLSESGAFSPNPLAHRDSPREVFALLAAGVLASLLLAVGWKDRLAALVLWYLLACVFTRNPLIANPALPYLGWILLAHLLVPSAPAGSLAARGNPERARTWRYPNELALAAWIVMAAGYSYSGWTKLASPSWVDGTALRAVLENPLARDTALRELLLRLPEGGIQLGSWGVLGLELAFAPLALCARLRPWLWALFVALHLSLIALIAFTSLSVGMLCLHAFTLDPRWVRAPCLRAWRFWFGSTERVISCRIAPLPPVQGPRGER